MAAPNFDQDHKRAAVPGGPTVFTPKRTITADATEAVVLTHAPYRITITAGVAELAVGWSQASVEATPPVGKVIYPGDIWDWVVPVDENGQPLAADIPKIWVHNTDTVSGDWQAEIHLSRRPIGNGPDLTVANSFPQYDGTTATAIVPGVA